MFLFVLIYRFEGKLMPVIEHFHAVMTSISSRMRAEQFKVSSLAVGSFILYVGLEIQNLWKTNHTQP